MKIGLAFAVAVIALASTLNQARATERDSVFTWGPWTRPGAAAEFAPGVREVKGVLSNDGLPVPPLSPAASATIAKPVAGTPPAAVAPSPSAPLVVTPPPPPPVVIPPPPPPPVVGVAPGNSGNTPGNSGQLKGNSGFTPSAHPNPPARGRNR